MYFAIYNKGAKYNKGIDFMKYKGKIETCVNI